MDERFSDEEVSLILRRALEADRGEGERGLTLGQLKEIAAEVGIDPAGVESAALTVQAERSGAETDRHGTRTSTRYDVKVRGEVDRERFGEMLRIIRGATGRQGVVTEAFGGLEWKARDFFGGRYVTVRPENGQTRVEALGNYRDGAFVSGAMGGTGGLAISALMLKGSIGVAALGVLTPVALLAGAAVPAFLLYRRWFRREDEVLRRVVAGLAAELRNEPPEEAGDGSSADPGPAAALPGAEGRPPMAEDDREGEPSTG